jgi:aspartyl-tRNA(Asn)/glutamyl-tRNA(Gln) amidotransferase subunit A
VAAALSENAIKKWNDKYNAFITITQELAISKCIESSTRIQNEKKLSALDGIVIAVKDNFCTKNIPTTCASK